MNFEYSMDDWKKVNIVHNRHEIEFGNLISGLAVQEIKAERFVHVPGKEPLLNANIHFHCVLSDLECDSSFELTMGGKGYYQYFQDNVVYHI